MGNQPAAFQLHINHKLIPNVSQKRVVFFRYTQRKDGVSSMNTKNLLALALSGVLLVGCLAGCSASASAPPDGGTPQNISYQPQTIAAVGNETSGSSATEIPGGSVDYSVYEPYGLVYDKENHYYTFSGNVVRFFNDPVAGASFTNFFSGTVDIEAEYDGNKLIGVKECSKEVYDWHTQRHDRMSGLTGGTTAQVGGASVQSWLKDYADYGITYNAQDGGWYYNNQRIMVLVDGEQPTVYINEEGSVRLAVSRDSHHQISEITEISDADAQLLLQNNEPVGEDYTTQN